jgi:hypothetical protein
MDRETAIAAATAYLGADAKGLWVESAHRITATDDDVAISRVCNCLGRELDELETNLALQNNRDHWLLQFVFMSTDPGDTPQGPAVSVFDDGDISHIRPM